MTRYQICTNIENRGSPIVFGEPRFLCSYLCVPTKKTEMTPGPVWAPMTGPT